MASAETVRPKHGYSADRDKLKNRLRRIEGQVRGVERMVDEDRYCIDIITQISAVQAALDKVALGVLDDHVRHCLTAAVRSSDDEAETKFAEINRAVGLALRL